jgi:hypothetical protein
MIEKKTITVKVENRQLDALEDLIMVELTPAEYKKSRKLALALWQNLVEAYDNKK